MDYDDFLRFMKEDAPGGDVTSNMFLGNEKGRAYGIAKDSFYISGLEEIKQFFGFLNVSFESPLKEGDYVNRGEKIFFISGRLKDILLGERVALNIIQRMSGITTLTRKFIDKVKPINGNVKIACTRKTTPGFRYYEKKAVEIAGGWTHRYSLSDAILIKDNHIAARGLDNILKINRETKTSLWREIEVVDLDELEKVLKEPFDIVMLDNFSVDRAKEAYELIKKQNSKVKIEISGGINLNNVELYAPYADIISIGALTHSYSAMDISLEIYEYYGQV
ncbi:MAG: carboxylating nicotinate-nucleotide diphosphorylase [Thermoplasmata archaeon]